MLITNEDELLDMVDGLSNEQYMICYGNPLDGFEYIGTFETADDASEYANTHRINSDWWVILLQEPCR